MSRLKLQAFLAASLLTFVLISLVYRAADAEITHLSAEGPLVLTNQQEEYPLGLHLDILEDPSKKLTIEQISSPTYEDKFVLSQIPVPIFGFTDSIYWVRINIHNETRNTDDWFLDVLYSNLQYVDLFTPQPNGAGFAVKQSGSARAPATRDLHFPRVVFSLTIPPQSQETIYMRFQSGTSMTLNLILWSQRAFFNHSILEQIAFGLFFGVLIGLFFYNLFILFAWKEVSYVYFVLLLASMILHEASYNGYLETYIIPSFYAYKIYYHPMLFTLLVVSVILFTDSFLEFKKRTPKLHWAVLVSLTGFGLLILLIPFVSYRIIATLLLYWTFLSLLTLLIAGIYNYFKEKFRPAPLFMFALFALVALFLDVLLVRLGVTPSTFFSENTYRLGVLTVAIFWSIALADRVNILKGETENANQELLKSERRLSEVLDGMPLGVALYTRDYKPKYANRSWFELLTDPARNIRPDISAGRTVAEAIKYYSLKPTGSTEPYPLENFPAFSALQGLPAYADDIDMHKGDQVIPLEVWASPIRNDAGEVESAVVVLQDITQRKQAEEILVDYRKHLESLVNERTTDLNNTNKELRLRLEWLAAVNFINQMIARSANFTEIHKTVVEIVNHLFTTQASFIAELSTENQHLKILTHSSSDQQPDLIDASVKFNKLISSNPYLELGKPILILKDEFALLQGPIANHLQISEIQSLAFVPLQVREHVLGYLGLEMREEGRIITPEEANLLAIFSTDIAQLLEDARLFEQAKLLAATEERNRLARELHDSVAQALYSISLFIDATRLALKTNKQKVAESHLEELTQLSREAMSNMRLLIFQLRPPILEKSGLVMAIQSRLESVEAKAGFQTRFETEGSFHLTASQESELYGITQEALNNVIKHAQAGQVIVRLTEQAGSLQLTIEDDGIGFDPHIDHTGGQGLRNMRERAMSMVANFTVESAPGQGTKITIKVNE